MEPRALAGVADDGVAGDGPVEDLVRVEQHGERVRRVAVDAGADPRDHRRVQRVDVDDPGQAAVRRVEGEALRRGRLEGGEVPGEVVGHPVERAAEGLVPLDQLQLGRGLDREDEVPQRAVDGHRSRAGHVDQAVGGRAHGPPDVRQRLRAHHDAEPGIAAGLPVPDGVGRMVGDPGIHVTPAPDLHARLDDVPHLHDARRLPGLDEVDRHATDPRVVQHERADPARVDGQPAGIPSGRGAEGD